jgi:site-specific DNA recombinase
MPPSRRPGEHRRLRDDLVTEALLYRLDSDGLARILASLDQDKERISALMRDEEVKRAKLTDLDTDYATGLLDRKQYARMAGLAKDALQAAQDALGRALASKTVVNLPVGLRVREAWNTWDFEQRRAVMALVIDKVVVHTQTKRPSYKDLGRFDPGFSRKG